MHHFKAECEVPLRSNANFVYWATTCHPVELFVPHREIKIHVNYSNCGVWSMQMIWYVWLVAPLSAATKSECLLPQNIPSTIRFCCNGNFVAGLASIPQIPTAEWLLLRVKRTSDCLDKTLLSERSTNGCNCFSLVVKYKESIKTCFSWMNYDYIWKLFMLHYLCEQHFTYFLLFSHIFSLLHGSWVGKEPRTWNSL